MNCQSCSEPLTGLVVTCTFEGFEQSRFDGTSFRIHARCLRFAPSERHIPLPQRVSDPIADSLEQVVVYLSEGEWLAHCRDCGDVAQKAEVDDAHLAAARHLARVHSGLVSA